MRLRVALGLLPLVPVPARAECFSGCGYGLIVGAMVAAALAVLALTVFVLVRSGLGWTIKWLAGAGLLALVAPPVIIAAVHGYKQIGFERFDHLGPLPRLADKVPLVVTGGDLAMCPDAVRRLVRARAGDGVLVLTLWPVEAVDFTQPVRLADLPIARHTGGVETVVDGYVVDGTEVTFAEERWVERVVPLAPTEREAAMAEVDYLVLAACREEHAVFEALRGHPMLAKAGDFEVELALAPVADGRLSVADLDFDLLDVRFAGVTQGFLLAGGQWGGANQSPYDPEQLAEALCLRKDGTWLAECRD